MGYRPDKQRLGKFYRYIQRVFSFQQQVKQLNDHRTQGSLSTESLFEALFLGLLLQLGSFRALGFEINHGQAKKVFRHQADFCVNALRYGLEFFEIEPLDHFLLATGQKMKRNQMLSDTIGGLHVAGLDGTEFFRSSVIHCPDCMEVHLANGEVQFVHRAVFLQHVGGQLKPFLVAEPIRPKDPRPGDREAGHEGERTAAKRLLRRGVQMSGKRFIDLLTCDALYMNQPFISHCHSLGFELVARVKDERTTLFDEITRLKALVTPQRGYDATTGIAYTIYEIPDLHLSLGWEIPLRGFLIEERSATDTQTFLCATTNLKAPADIIRRIVHQKWGLENNGIRDLKTNWHLLHNSHHHPIATGAIVMTLLIVYNLFYASMYRNLKVYRIYHLTQAQVQREMIYSYFSLDYRLPWARWVFAP